MSIIGKKKSLLSGIFSGIYKLTNPENVDSQISKSDLADDKDPYDLAGPDWRDTWLIKLGEERYEEARMGRNKQMRHICEGVSLFRGEHDKVFNENSGNMESVAPPTIKERFVHKINNVTRVLCERAQARMLAQFPDAWVAPLTDAQSDKLSAHIGRAVTAHCNRVIDLQDILEDTTLNMLITSTTFVEIGWDPMAESHVGLLQSDGSIKYDTAKIGDICAQAILGVDAYPDPNAALFGKSIHDGEYFIKRSRRPVSFIARKWGVIVDPDTGKDQEAWMKQRLSWIAGDYSQSSVDNKYCASVTEVWEKPSEQFPDGRFWVYTAKRVLHKGPWPYEKKDKYPFVQFFYQRNTGSIWGLNLTMLLRDAQYSINRLETYMNGRTEWDCPVIFAPDNSNIAPEDYISPHYGKVIYFTPSNAGGAMPTWQAPPAPGSFYFERAKQLLEEMEYLAGVRDFNEDGATSPNSGKEYELRMQEDKSRLGPVVKRIARGVCEIYEWELALYRQFGVSFPRLLGLDDQNNKAIGNMQDAPQVQLMDLTALREGQCRVVLQPGSGEAKLPSAQADRLDEMILLLSKLLPPLAQFYLEQSNDIKSDAQVDRLIEGLKAVYETEQATKPNPMAQQQAKQEATKETLQMKMQAEAEQAQALANIQLQAEGQKSAIAVHTESLAQTWRMQADLATEKQRFAHQMSMMNAKNQSPPKISLAGTLNLDPVMLASAGQAAGLHTSEPKDIETLTSGNGVGEGKDNGNS